MILILGPCPNEFVDRIPEGEIASPRKAEVADEGADPRLRRTIAFAERRGGGGGGGGGGGAAAAAEAEAGGRRNVYFM